MNPRAAHRIVLLLAIPVAALANNPWFVDCRKVECGSCRSASCEPATETYQSAIGFDATTGRLASIGDGTHSFAYGYVPGHHLIAAVTNTWEPDRNVLAFKQNTVGTVHRSGKYPPRPAHPSGNLHPEDGRGEYKSETWHEDRGVNDPLNDTYGDKGDDPCSYLATDKPRFKGKGATWSFQPVVSD